MSKRWWLLALVFAAYASIATLAAGAFVGSGFGLFVVSMTVAFFVARLFLRPRANTALAAAHSGAATPN